MYSSKVHIILAGLPAITTFDGTDFVTILPAATNTLFPIETPGIINEFVPI